MKHTAAPPSPLSAAESDESPPTRQNGRTSQNGAQQAAATILALDASSTTIGWVVWSGEVVDHGTIHLKGADIADRCRQAFAHIGGLIEQHPDLDCVCIESCVSRFGGAVIPQARVSGAIFTRVALFGLLVCEVTPQQAKKALAGKGGASKAEMMGAAASYGTCGEHEADALGVALAAVGMVKVERVAA